MKHSSPISVVHIITGLGAGGAETMLAKLLGAINSSIFSNHVISLSTIGPIGEKISESGVPTHALNMPAGRLTAKGLLDLRRHIRRIEPSIIQTWLYHADFLGLVLGRLAGVSNICWNIRCAYMDLSKYRKSTRWVLKLCSLLSRLPTCIICNSNEGIKYHKKFGYRNRCWHLIPNGFDLELFKPDQSSRNLLIQEICQSRQKLGFHPEKFRLSVRDRRNLFVGYVARFDPMKDHLNFISAAKILLKQSKHIHFVLIGNNISWKNKFFATYISPEQKKYFHLLGERDDIWRLTPAFDIASSASFGESFPNVVCEAMACGIPCVVTDVGDCAEIVGNTGIVVEPRNPQALANGWLSLINSGRTGRKRLGNAARERVMNHYDITAVTQAYEERYKSMVLKSVTIKRT